MMIPKQKRRKNVFIIFISLLLWLKVTMVALVASSPWFTTTSLFVECANSNTGGQLSKKIASMMLRNSNISRSIGTPTNCLFVRCSSNNDENVDIFADNFSSSTIKNDLYELNPDYQNTVVSAADDDDDSDNLQDTDDDAYSNEEGYDDNDNENDEDSESNDSSSSTLRKALLRKSKAKKAKRRLGKSIKSSSKSLSKLIHGSLITPVGTFLKKYSIGILVSCTILAFRNEIKLLMYRFVSTPIIDSTTGKLIGRKVNVNPTAIVKVIVFVEIMRRLIVASQLQGTTRNNGTSGMIDRDVDDMDDNNNDPQYSPLFLLLSLLFGGMDSFGIGGGGGAGMKFIMLLLLQLLNRNANRIINTAFVPPIEQHYTFERINERYQKDHLAYLKVSSRTAIATIKAKRNDTQQTEIEIDSVSKASPAIETTSTSTEFTTSNSTSIQTTNITDSDVDPSSVLQTLSKEQKPAMTRMTLFQFLLSGIQTSRFSKPGRSSSSEIVTSPQYNGTVIVLDWTGLDSSIASMDVLRDKVSFIIHEYNKELLKTTSTKKHTSLDDDDTTTSVGSLLFEVVVLLESPGGSASDYALASSQLLRMRNIGIQVTICVDKVAASGGYMIACAASPGQLIAAPFAVVGSIGVIGQTINIQRTLEGWGVRPLVFRGGKYKAPVGLLGDVTETGLQKVQSIVDDTHVAFQRYVIETRPIVQRTINQINTGDIWLGYNAISVGLIDQIGTSDEYIYNRIVQDNARVVKLVQMIRPKYPFFAKPTTLSSLSLSTTASKVSSTTTTSTAAVLMDLIVPILTDFRKLLDQVMTLII